MRDGTHAAQSGEAGFGSHAVRIVTGREQNCADSRVANGVSRNKARRQLVDDGGDHAVEIGDLVVQFEVAAGQGLRLIR